MVFSKSKYGSVKTVVDGITFDSKLELNRYCYLKLLERAGELKSVVYHKKYVLQESFINSRGKHRAGITYTPDFIIMKKDGTFTYTLCEIKLLIIQRPKYQEPNSKIQTIFNI